MKIGSVWRFARNLSVLLLFGAVSISSPAQGLKPCLFHDGLSGPCCQRTNVHLPSLPAVPIDALVLCWSDCNLVASAQCIGFLTKPRRPPRGGLGCGVFKATLSCPNSFSADVKLVYTRSYPCDSPALGKLTVFRCLILGNMFATNVFCPIESPPQPALISGFVDFAFKCISPPPDVANPSHVPDILGPFQAAALMVHHSCPGFSHDPNCVPVPGAHPGFAWDLVHPAASFVPNPFMTPPASVMNTTPPGGFRTLNPPNAIGCTNNIGCTVNEKLVFASLQNVTNFCVCNRNSMNPQYTAQMLFARTECGSTLAANAVCPYNLFGTGSTSSLFTDSIGAWVGTTPWPAEPCGFAVWATEGSLNYDIGICPACPSLDIYYGVMTRSQFPPTVPPCQAPEQLVDLVNNQDPNNVLNGLPGILGTSTHALFFNPK